SHLGSKTCCIHVYNRYAPGIQAIWGQKRFVYMYTTGMHQVPKPLRVKNVLYTCIQPVCTGYSSHLGSKTYCVHVYNRYAPGTQATQGQKRVVYMYTTGMHRVFKPFGVKNVLCTCIQPVCTRYPSHS